jgi:hypothetical protein
VWRGRRRIRRLEDEITAARVERAELRRRLEVFEKIAGAAGAALPEPQWQPTRQSASPMPANLAAAARTLRPEEAPIVLDVGGTEVIAVIGGPGNPRQWWSAVCEVAGQPDVAGQRDVPRRDVAGKPKDAGQPKEVRPPKDARQPKDPRQPKDTA